MVLLLTLNTTDRICTVEATALFLSHLGVDEHTCDSLVDCVRINNNAIRPSKISASNENETIIIKNNKERDYSSFDKSLGSSRFLYTTNSFTTHPCWYYGKYYGRNFSNEEINTEILAKSSKKVKSKRRYL